MASICQALFLSDEQKCTKEATHANGLFCGYHSKQAFGMYKGYKRRNAMLDNLDNKPPPYLEHAAVPLANDGFGDIQDEKILRQVHSYLHEKYTLLGQVIDARQIHHKHFYPLNVDYGHQAYIDKLISQRHIVLRAMTRCERRFIAVNYENERWYTWVRNAQEVEEANREKEQKKIKQEAALFRRHMKQLETRLKLMRQKEDKKRQDAYLEDAYRERMAMSADESDDDESWDPIEDIEQRKRDRYLDLIKHFLWMELLDEAKESSLPAEPASSAGAGEPTTAEEPKASKKKRKNKAKASSNNAKQDATESGGVALAGQRKLVAIQQSGQYGVESELREPDKNNIETEEEMRSRLRQGVKKNLDKNFGMQLVGTLENPYETYDKTAPMEKDEVDSLMDDIREIKLFLFCRLLLSQASLLPVALRATSVQEFLRDTDVAESDLRDLCLKVAEPTLQDIRDACADFARGDEVGEDPISDDEDDEGETLEELLKSDKHYSHLHTNDWFRDKILKDAEKSVVSRKIEKASPRKTKVTICGKSIWDHASEKAMSRDGWLQFSVMAKDCDLKHAIQLCRNWNEFADLNLLTLWQYFPASNWSGWSGNRLLQQLQQLGFFPYFTDFEAEETSHHRQVGGRSQLRRQHDIVETRNVLVGNMKRGDPVTRRFIQYLLLRAGEVLVMVRDGKNGRVITAPTDDQLWTYRKKQGVGRASKNEWLNLLEMGPDFFALTDKFREWRFGFHDYYDIFIWDFVPGQSSMDMYNIVALELRNVWRITQPRDIYLHMKPLLQGLHRNEQTMRTRRIRPGENVKTLWEHVTDVRNEFRLWDLNHRQVTCHTNEDIAKSPYMFYSDVNAAEDAILFPDELASNRKNVPFREIRNGVSNIEDGVLPSKARYIAKGLEAINKGQDPINAINSAKDQDEDSIWSLPKVWKTGLAQARQESPSRVTLLRRTGLLNTRMALNFAQRIDVSDPMELMERDQSFSFKESFHAGDLEPGYNEKYEEVQEKIRAMLKTPHSGSTQWVWYLIEILDWLALRGDYEEYADNPADPWPHSFIVHDLVQAFAAMAMFFPECEVAKLVTQFLSSKQCDEFRKSVLFDPKERSKTRPDRRTRTSYKFRDKKFWKEWEAFYKDPKRSRYYADVYPLEWSRVVRPIIAHLYRAGVVAPAYIQNHPQVIAGMVTAKEEPHRPGKLDMFINYQDQYGSFPMSFPPSFLHPDKWPQVLPHAQDYAAKHDNARFALLRLWSAPHYYSLMVGLNNRQGTSFLDSCGRSWEWKFVPKDMPGSEWSAHHTTERRLQILEGQFKGHVMNRGDLILVMGEEADELLKYCTAVMFAIQTKPWLREVDLWKSFINVDLDFILDLDPVWLE
ncbi:hypothetical protein F66182_8462 [Fusarium sp. NRRL 66182]|nr:hypothetical protein F66182_8462 [Fusarium sp. NRRL 66182]